MKAKTIKIGKIKVNFYDCFAVYFLKTQQVETMLALEATPEGMVDMAFRSAFDYRRYQDKHWKIYIDVAFSAIGYFDTYIRSSFVIKCDLKNLFIVDTIKPLVKAAFEQSALLIMENSKKNKFPFEDAMIPFNTDSLISNTTNEMITTFNTMRLEEETFVGEKNVKSGLTVPADEIAQFILPATVVVMDKILFDNEYFDWKYNQEVFTKVMEIHSYMTMRGECLEIEDGPVLLNWHSATYLVICFDCVLQLLLGDHSEKLVAGLAKQGLSEGAVQQYIEHCSKVLTNLKQGFIRDKINITNLETIYDWNKMLK